MTQPVSHPLVTFAHWYSSAPSAVVGFTDAFLDDRHLDRLEDIPAADWPAYAAGAKAAARAPRITVPAQRPTPKASLPGDPVDLITGEAL